MAFFKSVVAPERKATAESFDTTTDWYERNGYYRLAGGYRGTASGKEVNEITALQASAVYACVKILSEDMGTFPFFTYERNGNMTGKAFNHRLFPVLHGLVNPNCSSGEFVEALTAHAALTGNGFAKIERFGKNRVFLRPWQPADVRVEGADDDTVYIHKDGDKERAYRPRDVFHLRGLTFDCVMGDRVLERARELIGLALASQEYAGSFLANDVSASLFFEHPSGDSTTAENVKTAYEKKQGTGKAGEPFFLYDGLTAKRLDPDMEKMQLVETRKFQIQEVCRIFRMPPHKLADLERASFSNIEQQSIEYVQHTLSPWLRRWKEAVHRCLLTRDEQIAGRIYAEHSVESLLRGDFKAQTDGFRAMLEKGVYSINEVRKWLNMNPVEGGDTHHVQLNMQDITDTASELTGDEE